MKKAVAVYARVSTVNHQDPETQLLDLRKYAEARSFKIFKEYVDQASGASETRPSLDQLMKDARRRKFDTVLVWKFDRFARSTKQLVLALEEFNALGIDFISLSESIDTSTPMGKMVFTLVSAIAEFERSLIQERIKAGLRNAREKGKKLGRPKGRNVSEDQIRKILTLREKNLSIVEIGEKVGISASSVFRILHDLKRS